jgi:hypothetical protein
MFLHPDFVDAHHKTNIGANIGIIEFKGDEDTPAACIDTSLAYQFAKCMIEGNRENNFTTDFLELSNGIESDSRYRLPESPKALEPITPITASIIVNTPDFSPNYNFTPNRLYWEFPHDPLSANPLENSRKFRNYMSDFIGGNGAILGNISNYTVHSVSGNDWLTRFTMSSTIIDPLIEAQIESGKYTSYSNTSPELLTSKKDLSSPSLIIQEKLPMIVVGAIIVAAIYRCYSYYSETKKTAHTYNKVAVSNTDEHDLEMQSSINKIKSKKPQFNSKSGLNQPKVGTE